MTYSLDFRKKVLTIKKEEGLTFEEISKRFKVGKTTILRWSKNIEPKRTRNKPPSKIGNDALKKDVEMYPDAYLYERAEKFGVTPKGIFDALKRLGITNKKNPESSQSGSRKKIYVLPDS